MTRDEAVRHLRDLYDIADPWMSDIISEMGLRAFSDEAIIRMAQRQINYENAWPRAASVRPKRIMEAFE